MTLPPTRRALLRTLPLAAVLAGCSVLPDRPYQEVQRFALAPERPQRAAPERPQRAAPARTEPVLLVRTLRAAPGLDVRGLRLLGADGQVTTEYWQEWAAPPADLTEEALRRWLTASGRYSAVTLPGSRLRADIVLEGELIRLQAEPAAGQARAALSVLALAQPQSGNGEARILGQFLAEGTAPLARRGTRVVAAEAAAAMSAALGLALAQLEQQMAGLPAPRR